MEVERLGRRLLQLYKCKEILPRIKFEFLWLLLKSLILICHTDWVLRAGMG